MFNMGRQIDRQTTHKTFKLNLCKFSLWRHQKLVSPEHKLWYKFQCIVLSEAKQGLKSWKNNFQASALKAGQRYDKAHSKWYSSHEMQMSALFKESTSVGICLKHYSKASFLRCLFRFIFIYIGLYDSDFFCCGATTQFGPIRPKTASFLRFLGTHTPGRVPLNEWSACRSGHYLHNTL